MLSCFIVSQIVSTKVLSWLESMVEAVNRTAIEPGKPVIDHAVLEKARQVFVNDDQLYKAADRIGQLLQALARNFGDHREYFKFLLKNASSVDFYEELKPTSDDVGRTVHRVHIKHSAQRFNDHSGLQFDFVLPEGINNITDVQDVRDFELLSISDKHHLISGAPLKAIMEDKLHLKWLDVILNSEMELGN